MEVRHTKRTLSELVVNPNNPRILRDKRFKELKTSIEQDPKMLEARPICISMHPNRLNQIVGGNMRFQAVKSLGWKEVPVAELHDGTEEEENRWMLKDNGHFGEWDFDALANSFDVDFLKSVGFDENELKKMFDPNIANSIQKKSVFEIVVEAKNEVEQQEIYEILIKQGFVCRILTL